MTDNLPKILILSLLLVIAGFGVYFILKQSDPKTPENKKEEDRNQNDSGGTGTNTNVTLNASGEEFSKLYGWATILGKTPEFFSGLSQFIQGIKNNKNNLSSPPGGETTGGENNLELMCKTNPLMQNSPLCL